MDAASLYLVAAPQTLADALRQAAVTWDPAGADTMFRAPTLHPASDPASLYVFAYGLIADGIIGAVQAAAPAFPGAVIIQADTFAAALAQAELTRVVPAMP